MQQAQEAFILVVDDSDEDLFLFKRLISRAGVALGCQSASGAAPAIALLSAAMQAEAVLLRPVVCFVDIKMPGENGFDLLQWIRAQPVLAALPVVMLSSSDEPSDLMRAAEMGAQCYLTKYPATTTLARVIEDARTYPNDPLAFEQPYNLLLPAARRLLLKVADLKLKTKTDPLGEI